MFQNMTQLRFLSMHSNRISSIAPGAFNSNKALEELYLDNNDITLLPAQLFDFATKLTIVKIGKNKIGSLPEKLFINSPLLGHVSLHNNAFASLPLAWFPFQSSLQSL
jgi:Leucine-rich repeat (LRR) protein